MASGCAESIDRQARPVYSSGFRVGGVAVQLASLEEGGVDLAAPLEPFRTEVDTSDIDIHVEWVAGLAAPAERSLFDSGSVWRLYPGDSGYCFDFCVPALGDQPYKRLLVDGRFSMAVLQMNRTSIVGTGYRVAPLEYPLDELLIMHRLTQEKAIELHGAGIVRANGVANLFVGHSGAGKSTTTRLWTERENVEVLSDDRIIVRHDEFSPTSVRMYGTPWHGEAMYASPNSAPVARIFVLEHGQGNVITPLTPSQAVAELFARSFVPFHRHEYVDSALVFLEEVANAVPVYRYAFEPDHRAVEKICNFHD